VSESLDGATGELVPLTLSTAETATYMDEYDKVCRLIIKSTDVQRIGKSEFIKRSGWRKLGVWALVSAEILEETEIRDESGRLLRAKYKVRAIAPNGRHMDGIGICDRSERSFTKPEHDIPATAHTRAINRAFADLFGLGAVSAEEMAEAPYAEVERLERERTVSVKIDPEIRALADRMDALGEAERKVFIEWRDSHNVPDNRAGRRAIAKQLDRIEAGRAEQASEPHDPAGASHYDPDDASPFD
jgi:hypothetical protein